MLHAAPMELFNFLKHYAVSTNMPPLWGYPIYSPYFLRYTNSCCFFNLEEKPNKIKSNLITTILIQNKVAAVVNYVAAKIDFLLQSYSPVFAVIYLNAEYYTYCL